MSSDLLRGWAQTVTIQVRGERNGSILVDGQTYGVSQDPSSVNNANLPIVISDLSLGAHTVQVMRVNRNSGSYSPGMAATFSLRSGYDMDILITASGGIQLSEKKASLAGVEGSMNEAILRCC